MAEHSTLQVLCRNTQTALANAVRPNDPADAVVNVAPSTGTPPMASAATEVVLANAVKLNDCAAPTEAVVDGAPSADSPPPTANAVDGMEVVLVNAVKLNDCAAPTEAAVDGALSADSHPPTANAAIEVVPADAAKTATRDAVQTEQLWA
jgi:hypothetical protein